MAENLGMVFISGLGKNSGKNMATGLGMDVNGSCSVIVARTGSFSVIKSGTGSEAETVKTLTGSGTYTVTGPRAGSGFESGTGTRACSMTGIGTCSPSVTETGTGSLSVTVMETGSLCNCLQFQILWLN